MLSQSMHQDVNMSGCQISRQDITSWGGGGGELAQNQEAQPENIILHLNKNFIFCELVANPLQIIFVDELMHDSHLDKFLGFSI